MCTLKNVVVNEQVVAQEGELVLHVGEQATDQGSKVDHVCRLVFVKDGLGLFERSAEQGASVILMSS